MNDVVIIRALVLAHDGLSVRPLEGATFSVDPKLRDRLLFKVSPACDSLASVGLAWLQAADERPPLIAPRQKSPERRLVAIFCADAANYSRLMGKDEVETLRVLTAHRAVMESLISQHWGRIANRAGDSVLAQFPSVVDAVQCAAAVQERLGEANETVPEDRRLQFRIGVHVSDVMIQGDDLFGNGVNIAARLQALAEPGGLCLSAETHAHIRKVLPLAFEDLGLQRVKNIDEPVRVYSYRTRSSDPAPDISSATVVPFTKTDGERRFLTHGGR